VLFLLELLVVWKEVGGGSGVTRFAATEIDFRALLGAKFGQLNFRWMRSMAAEGGTLRIGCGVEASITVSVRVMKSNPLGSSDYLDELLSRAALFCSAVL
jgi:hypothetical protein